MPVKKSESNALEQLIEQQNSIIEEQKMQIEALSQQLAENSFMGIIAANIKEFIDIYKDNKKHEAELEKASMQFTSKMSNKAIWLVVFIISVAGVLTFFQKIDGSTFTFLLGLIVGYVLTFIKQSINPENDYN